MKKCIKCNRYINTNAQLCEFCGELFTSSLIENNSQKSKITKKKFFFKVMGNDYRIMLMIASEKELKDIVINNNLNVNINNIDGQLKDLENEILNQFLLRELNYNKHFSFQDVELIYDPNDKFESNLEMLEHKETNYNSIIFNEIRSQLSNQIESKYLLIGLDCSLGSEITYSFEYSGKYKDIVEIFKNSYFKNYSYLYNLEEIFTQEDTFENSSKIELEDLSANNCEESLVIMKLENLEEDIFEIIKILNLDGYF